MSANQPYHAGPIEGGYPDRGSGRRGPRRKRGGRAEEPMVPDAHFTSYYGRPVVKPSPWKPDIPTYFFFGGLAGGTSLLAAGADLTNRPQLRRATRIAALSSVGISLYTLIHDLGRPSRAFNMLRVFKPTSPMSVGTWFLSALGPGAGVAAVAEIADLLPIRLGLIGRLLHVAARPAGLWGAAVAPAVATYTGVLISDTATPAWHDGRHEMPFVFAASSAAASGGFGMLAAPVSEAAPARRMAAAGAIAELAMTQKMERSMGLSAETMHTGTGGRFMRAAKTLTAAGALGTLLLGRRSRIGAAASGAALLAGSFCTRFGIFHAGQASARDPKYTVVPQRERLNRNQPAGERRSDENQPTGDQSADHPSEPTRPTGE
jgi:formate-dependent nitrite reductase membrane component NrfD